MKAVGPSISVARSRLCFRNWQRSLWKSPSTRGAICYIACDYIPSLFRTAYPNKEALRREFEEKLSAAGVTMPEDFDWWRYIVKVNGTNFS